MKLTTLFSALFIGVASITGATAQTGFDVPEDVEFESAEDYAAHESNIIAAAQWLEETDLDKEIDKRKEVNGYVLLWLTGSPSVSVELTEAVMKLYEKNDDLLGIYLASYARYVLEHKDEKGKFAPTKAAVQSMLKVYNKGISIKKNKEILKAIKMEKEGTLDDYITDTIGVAKD